MSGGPTLQHRLRALGRRGVLAVLLVALSALPPVAGQVRTAGLPNLGDGEDMSVAAERRLGQRIAREIYRDPDYLDDPVLGDYLQSIWQPLLAASRARGELGPELDERFAWKPVLVRERSVNAFALPGGYLGVHLGLIALVGSRDELASVLGHELSHVTQRHIARLTTQQSRQAPWVIGAMILGVLAGRKSPDAANATIAGSQAVAAQSQLNFSRDMEREADRIGFSVMTDAGFDGAAFVSMFGKLQQANRINDNGSFPYLRSHPLTTERIADAQLRMAQGAHGDAPPVGMEALLMGARAKVLTDPGVDALRSWTHEASMPATARLPQGRHAAVLYAAILSQLRLKTLDGLEAWLAELVALTAQDVPAAHAVRLLAAEVALAQGQAAHALDLLPAEPGSRAVMLLTAQALALLATPDALARAAGMLQTWVALRPEDAQAWQQLAQVYRVQDQPVRAIRADAESRVAQLDYAAALDRFQAAQALLRSHARSGSGRIASEDMEASIIDTRTRQTQSLVREQALER